MDHYYKNIQGWFDYESVYTTVVNNLPNNSHIVEIGCWKGASTCFLAVEIINSGKNIKLDCVDTWKGSYEHGLTTEKQFDELYKTFLKNIEPVKHVVNPIRKPSIEAANMYPDSSLDFVYIDAAHDYENVKLDIQSWYPKVKVGGIIGGHDYHFSEVTRAVDEAFPKEKILVNYASWLYIK